MATRLWLVAQREVRSYLADRSALAFSLLLPAVVLGLLIASFGNGTTFHGTGYVVDSDGGPAAQSLITQLRSVDGLHVTLLTAGDARQRLDHASILLYTEIPRGFSAKLSAGHPAQLIEYRRGNGAQADQIVAAYISQAARRLGAETEVRNQVSAILGAAGASLPANQLQDTVGSAVAQAEANPPIAVVTENTKAVVDYPETMFPGVLIMFALLTVTLNAQSLVQQRRQGTFERLRTTRLTAGEFLAGLFLGNVFCGLIQLIVLYSLAAIALHFFTLSSFFWSFLFGVFVIVAASALSLVIAVLVRSQEQAIWIPVFVTMLMTIFGGTFYAVAPETTLGTVARATLTFWANDGLHRIISHGASLAGVAGPLAVMAGVAIAGLLASGVIFTQTLRRTTT